MQFTTLKTALLSNAVFSTLSGLVFIFFSHFVADLIGIAIPAIYQILGVSLLGFAGLVAWTATRKPIDTLLAAVISIADFLWVLGTILLFTLAFGTLNLEGILVLSGIAFFVMCFGLFQLHGINRVYGVPGKPDTQRLCVMVDTPAQPEEIWPLIADLASIQTYSSSLRQVILKDNAESGVGAVRQCTDVNGKTWSEHCRRYDAQARSIELEFLTDEPGFPYPFKTMSGGWDVESSATGATVHIWFEVTPKYGIAHPIMLAVMARKLDTSFGEVVARMTAVAKGETVPTEITLAKQGIKIKSVLATCN